MKGDCHLDESLPDFLFFGRRSPPHIFQNLMSVKKLALIEQLDPAKVFMLD